MHGVGWRRSTADLPGSDADDRTASIVLEIIGTATITIALVRGCWCHPCWLPVWLEMENNSLLIFFGAGQSGDREVCFLSHEPHDSPSPVPTVSIRYCTVLYQVP